jgi:adenylyl cyclase-associated protein
VKSLVAAQRAFLVKASKCKQPAQDQLMMELKPMADCIQQIQSFREVKRGSEFFNHLSTLSEAVPAFGWVSMSPAPAPFAKEMADAGQFYSNRVLKDWKEKDVTHKDWVQSWNKAMGDLQAYIKQWHTTGVAWNAKGVDVSSFGASRGAAAPPPPPPAGGAPPPPPPPAIQPPTGAPPASDSSSGDGERAALFAELSKGSDITKGLKKVTDDMKTHKNPNLKLQTPRPYKASPPTAPKPFKPVAAASPVKQVAAPKKPPKFELDGKKWLVEFQDGNRNIVISDTNIKQTVYIYKCTNSTIQVQGKVNSIVVDNCKKVGVVFENVISSCEFVNCQSVQGQVTGKVPTVSIDKTDGCMMYLSAESTEAEIYSAKSSEMNILIPDASGEYKEFAVPEQYKTTWNGKALVTTTTESI